MHAVPMLRRISPVADLISVCRLFFLLRRIRPDLIQTHTPKGGLLGMIASWVTGTPVRIYTINGLVWIALSGWRRALLMSTERLACKLATDVIAVSESMRRIAIDLRVCPAHKIRVLGFGASHGVDTARFDPEVAYPAGMRLRARLGVPENALLLTYVGRLTREKGIEELAVAWQQLNSEFENLHLLLCGTWEDRVPVSPSTVETLGASPRVHFARGEPAEMPAFYAASNLCVLPTWREGLPNVALEAAAMNRAIVATKVPGCIDAIQDGVTGLLVEPRNAADLAAALRRLLSDQPLCQRMGERARQIVLERFREEVVSERLAIEYRRLLNSANCGQ